MPGLCLKNILMPQARDGNMCRCQRLLLCVRGPCLTLSTNFPQVHSWKTATTTNRQLDRNPLNEVNFRWPSYSQIQPCIRASTHFVRLGKRMWSLFRVFLMGEWFSRGRSSWKWLAYHAKRLLWLHCPGHCPINRMLAFTEWAGGTKAYFIRLRACLPGKDMLNDSIVSLAWQITLPACQFATTVVRSSCHWEILYYKQLPGNCTMEHFCYLNLKLYISFVVLCSFMGPTNF